METPQEVIDLYAEMTEMTKPKCAACPLPYNCCATVYCNLADKFAEYCGVTLERTDHPTLPFMGPSGCTVPPHLRPICAIHVCEGHLLRDEAFREKYLDLRYKLGEADTKRLENFPVNFHPVAVDVRGFWDGEKARPATTEDAGSTFSALPYQAQIEADPNSSAPEEVHP